MPTIDHLSSLQASQMSPNTLRSSVVLSDPTPPGHPRSYSMQSSVVADTKDIHGRPRVVTGKSKGKKLGVVNQFRWFIFPMLFVFGTLTLPDLFSLSHRQRVTSKFPDLYEASIADLQKGLEDGDFTSVDLVKAYFARIEEVNRKGPMLHAVIELNPSALAAAAQLDKERKEGKLRGDLHGIPVLLKDNIATIAEEGMNTTAGSWALYKSVVPGDAGVVTRLRKAGAILLGKANLSEWSHFRGRHSGGWSGRGGQCSNPYFVNGDTCGSSSGSAVAAAIGLTAVALGTETHGSITCPSGYNNLVGIKPSVGLTSRAGVIPISEHQDTVGPMARSVRDAAIVLNAIAGPDAADNYTSIQPSSLPNYLDALDKNALKSKRIGVPRRVYMNATISEFDPNIEVVFTEALKVLESLGATIVDPADLPSADELIVSESEDAVLHVDFKIQLNAWFNSLLVQPSGVRSVSELIDYNIAHPETESPEHHDSNWRLIAANTTLGQRNETFWKDFAEIRELGRSKGIDATLDQFRLDALVLPTDGFTAGPSAVAGYPIVTVPMGFFPDDTVKAERWPGIYYPAPGIPLGLSFLGGRWKEFELIGLGYAYEQGTRTRLKKLAYAAAIPKTQLGDVIGNR